MRASTRRHLAMAARVFEFFRAHPQDQPSYRELLQELEACLARAEALVSERDEAALQLERATARKAELSRIIRHELGPRLAQAAKTVAAERPDLAELFSAAHGTSGQSFLRAAARILALVPCHGLDPTLIGDLPGVTEELQRVHTIIEECQRVPERSGRQLGEIILEMSRLIGRLDALNRHRFRGDGAAQEAWAAVRSIGVSLHLCRGTRSGPPGRQPEAPAA